MSYRRTVARRAAIVVCAAAVIFAGAVSVARAAETVSFQRRVGTVFRDSAIGTQTIVEAAGADVAVDGTVYVGGRWKPGSGGVQLVGVTAFSGDGAYQGRFGPFTDPASGAAYRMVAVTGVSAETGGGVWVSGYWQNGTLPWHGAVLFAADGSYTRRVGDGDSVTYFGANHTVTETFDVAGAPDGTVLLAGRWRDNATGIVENGVVRYDEAGLTAGIVGPFMSLDAVPHLEIPIQAGGVAAGPDGDIYLAGAWGQTPTSIGHVMVVDMFYEGAVRDIVIDGAASGLTDVDCDPLKRLAVSGTWREGESSQVRRFSATGDPIDGFGSFADAGSSYAPGSLRAVAFGADRPPVIEAVSGSTVREGDALELSIAASHETTCVVAGQWWRQDLASTQAATVFSIRSALADLGLSIQGLPQGAVFDAATGVLRWTPTRGQAGTYELVVSATDGSSVVQRSLTIDVSPLNSAPVATGAALEASEDVSLALVLAATDADTDGLTFRVEQQPAHGTLSGTPPHLTYAPDPDFNGADSFTFTAFDGTERSEPATVSIAVAPVDDAPVLRFEATALTLAEGSSGSLGGTWSDPDGETVSIEASPCGTVVTRADGTWEWTVDAEDGPEQGGPVTFTYGDGCGETFCATIDLFVDPLPPVVGSVDVPDGPVPVGIRAQVEGTFVDPGTWCPHSVLVNWGDGVSGAASVTESGGSGSFSASHAYSTPGLYVASLTCADDDGQTCTRSLGYIVVYDPSGGFVTGGGHIDSPSGAYTPENSLDADVVGTASFAFSARYQKGATAPIGVTAFRFDAGGLHFASHSYDWLVVGGTKATYKGQGSVNGEPGYRFMLSAVDGGTGGTDRLRMRIWSAATGDVLYDNQAGAADSAEPVTAVSAGNILVKTK